MAADTGRWLDALGLGNYADLFAENDIDLDAARDLTEADLKELGVTMGPRKKLLRAIAALRDEPDDAATTSVEPRYPPIPPDHLRDRVLADRDELVGERKLVTVLFADIARSTDIIQSLDPEVAQRLLDRVINAMVEAVHRFDGTVNRVQGDGIMALFGAPVAHEDHAVRACYAALAMQRDMIEVSNEVRRSFGVELRVRVGLNSGDVVVRAIGNDLSMDYDAIGATVHLASRMEQLALPGSIRLTGAAQRLAEGFVDVTPLGPVPVKGIDVPVEAFELVGAGDARTRLQASALRGLTPFVGRQSEMTGLEQAWQRVGSGEGQIHAVVGEPGVGKSRLFHEFTRLPRSRDWLLLEASSFSYGKAAAWHPIKDLLAAYFGIAASDSLVQIRERITGKVLTLDTDLRPVIAPILSLFDPEVDDPAWRKADPAVRRRRVLDGVRSLLVRESRRQPLVLMFEDLHWLDAESQAMLDGLVDILSAERILLLVNYRPQYRHDWARRRWYHEAVLEPFSANAAEEILDVLLGSDESVLPLRSPLLASTAGNPLFLEESVRALADRGALRGTPGSYRLVEAPTDLGIPASVQALIAARVDRLSRQGKETLQAAAVIGETVPAVLLQMVADADEMTVRERVDRLLDGGFLFEANLYPDLEFSFRHGLVRQVVYDGMLQQTRRAMHRKVGHAVLDLVTGRPDRPDETLAEHFERAGEWSQAAEHLLNSARKAKQRYSYEHALGFADRALAACRQDDHQSSRLYDIQLIRGDLLSLTGQIEAANDSYQEAAAAAVGETAARHARNRIHHPFFCHTDGVRLAYYMQGHGERTILIGSALTYGVEILQPLIEEFADKYRILTLDPRGTGRSDRFDDPHLTLDQMRDVASVIETADCGPVVGVGVSRGSNLFARLFQHHPELISHLVMVGPPLFSRFRRPGRQGRELEAAADRGDLKEAARILAENVYSEPDIEDFRKFARKSFEQLDRNVFTTFFVSDPALDIDDILETITIPTLITCGSEDRQIDPRVAPYIHERIPGSLLYLFEGRGHLPLFTATLEFCAVLRQFIEHGTVPSAPNE